MTLKLREACGHLVPTLHPADGPQTEVGAGPPVAQSQRQDGHGSGTKSEGAAATLTTHIAAGTSASATVLSSTRRVPGPALSGRSV